MIKSMLVGCTLFFVGCEQTVQHTRTETVNGTVTQQANYSQLTHQSALVEDSRKSCYAAIVDIEKSKASTNPALIALISKPNISEQTLMMVSMIIENNKLVDSLIDDTPPVSCNGMSMYDYQLAKSEVRHNFWDNFGENVMKYGTGAFLGDGLIDGLSRDAISAGAGAIVATDGGSVDNSDRRDLSTTTSTVDSNDISSSNSEAGAGDLNDSPELIEPEIEEEITETEIETEIAEE